MGEGHREFFIAGSFQQPPMLSKVCSDQPERKTTLEDAAGATFSTRVDLRVPPFPFTLAGFHGRGIQFDKLDMVHYGGTVNFQRRRGHPQHINEVVIRRHIMSHPQFGRNALGIENLASPKNWRGDAKNPKRKAAKNSLRQANQ